MVFARRGSTARSAYLLPFLFLVYALVSGQSHAAPVRLAILPGEGERAPGEEVIAQLEVALTEEKAVTLLERAEVEKILREQNLSASGLTDPATAVQVGKLLKAEALAIVSAQSAEGQGFIRLVICDTQCGARLSEDYVALEAAKSEPAVVQVLAAISRVRQRFPAGVQRVFGVPPFVSRNLTHEYDHMQRGYASLLSQALSQRRGVAVIEVEEARQIAREFSLTGGKDIARFVPLFVEGDFEVTRAPDGGEPMVAFRMKIADATGVKHNELARTIPLSSAAEWIANELSGLVAEAERVSATAPMSTDQQAVILIERADSFARLGGWEHSTGLREAALLLKDDGTEYEKLIREYCMAVTRGWPRGTVFDSESHLAQLRGRAALWHAALSHLEYVIRNRRTSQASAVALTDRLFDCAIRLTEKQRDICPPIESARKRFIRDVYPLARSLEDARHPNDWGDMLWRYGMRNFTSKEIGAEDYDFFFDIMTQTFPADACPPAGLASFMKYRADGPTVPPAHQAFVEKLARCDRPALRILARYAALYRQWCLKRAQMDLIEFQKELDRLSDDWGNVNETLNPPVRHSQVASQIEDLKRSVTLAIKAREREATAATPMPGPVKPAHPTALPGVELEPIDLMVKTLDGELVPAKRKTWAGLSERPGNPLTAHSGMLRMFMCGDGKDVLWQAGAIAVIREKGIFEEILVDPKAWISDVKWDGRNLWVASRCAGVSVISAEGAIVARFGEGDGLPPGDRGMLLQPLEPGKALIVGALGEDRRLWLALAQHDGPRATAEVFHEAVRAPVVGEEWKPDIHWAGTPSWTHLLEPADSAGVRRLLIGMSAAKGQVLQVDLSTLKVSTYPPPSPLSWTRNDNAYFSRAGRLYEADRSAQLLYYEDRLYEVNKRSGRWYRIDLDSGQRTELGRPSNDSRLYGHGRSSHYGIIGWGSAGFFKVAPRLTDEVNEK